MLAIAVAGAALRTEADEAVYAATVKIDDV
jgi:hypothetical protein